MRARVGEDPELKARYSRAWDEIAQAAAQERAMAERVMALEFSPQQSDLMLYALLLVRNASQLAKPDGQQLHTYRDSNQLDLVSTADVVGGNSGSPMVDRNGELVGLVFAVNDAFEAGAFGYDDTEMRAVTVSMPAILAALTSIYHADRIVQELDRK